MARTKISEFSATPANNTDIDSINIAEGCAPSGINDAIRELMAQLKDFQTGAVGDSFNGPIGATTASTGAFTTLSASSTTTLSGLTASTALALDASKNVVSVTNTGTGNNVLATSPTLVTPILGTPTSATLTNATGLPIATGVSGLGTGVATALAVNVGSAGAPVVNGGALGTPSSGTATNLTGLPLSTGVTGTLPTANGGTNLTSFTANGVVYASSSSVLATGSALTFDGTNLGVGGSSSYKLGVTGSSNNATSGAIQTVNSNAGTGTQTGLWASNGTQSAQFSLAGTGYTAYGAYAAGNAIIYNDQAITLMADNASTGVIKFAAGGNTEGMRLTSTGLGIGTSSPVARNHIRGSGTSGQVTASWILENASSGASGMDITGSAGASRWRFLYTGAGPSTGTNTFSEAMCILTEGASAGNVGIGTTSPDVFSNGFARNLGVAVTGIGATASINVSGGSGGAGRIQFGTEANRHGLVYADASNYMQIGTTASLPISFITNNTERARITSGGEFLVGATSNATPSSSTSMFVVQSNFRSGGTYGFASSFNSTGATGADHYYISFNTGTTTQRGYIYYNDGAGQIQLSATSDARLKENIVDAPDALPVLEQVRVRQYNWKETGNTNIGFVAQELYEVIPRAVGVGQDNEDGSIQRAWGVDNASLVPYLVKAIQEQQAIIESLKARLDAANL